MAQPYCIIFSEKDSLGKKVWAFIKTLRPSIFFDQLSGLPQVSFHVSDAKQPVIDLISFLEQWERPIIIAIDEFQQIHAYPEKNTDAWLRSVIQRLQNVFFLFSGSQQSILNELFSNPSRPFFQKCKPPSTQENRSGSVCQLLSNDFLKSTVRTYLPNLQIKC